MTQYVKIGPTESYLRKKAEQATLHFTLIDPDKTRPREAAELARQMGEYGTDAILVGGSIGVSQIDVDDIVRSIKEHVKLPIIIFPGNVSSISRYADAILFMSLLNSLDPYYIIGAQLLGSVIVKKFGLEAIPTAYIIIGEGGAAGHIGRAYGVPPEKPEIAAAYALTASMLGMRFVYFERGSGVSDIVKPETVSLTKKLVDNIFLIVGGGIRSEDKAARLASAGADAIVTGTIVEEDPEKASRIIKAIKHYGLKQK